MTLVGYYGRSNVLKLIYKINKIPSMRYGKVLYIENSFNRNFKVGIEDWKFWASSQELDKLV